MQRTHSIKNTHQSYKIKPMLWAILILVMSLNSSAQQKASALPDQEILLKKLGREILQSSDIVEREKANKEFTQLLTDLLEQAPSFSYPFDSVENIAILSPPDSSFRLLNWMLPKSHGEMEFFAIIQMNPQNSEECILFPLKDASAEIQNPQFALCGSKQWYGALYYKMISNKDKEGASYTLLGWNGHTNISNQKIIDVLTFNNKMEPIFGKQYFSNSPLQTRIIFEYHKQTSMSLKYEEQAYYKNNKDKEKGKLSRDKMIVYNRLFPMNEQLEGQFEYYYPSANVADAYIFEKNQWVLYKDIDARNPESKISQPQGKPDQGLFHQNDKN